MFCVCRLVKVLDSQRGVFYTYRYMDDVGGQSPECMVFSSVHMRNWSMNWMSSVEC